MDGRTGLTPESVTCGMRRPAAGTVLPMSYNEPPPPPPPGYGAPQAPYGGQPAGTSSKAIWSLVTGIIGLLCCGPLGIVAILLSRSAKDEIAATGKGGAGLAQAGFIVGIIALVFLVVQIILVATGNFVFEFNTSTS